MTVIWRRFFLLQCIIIAFYLLHGCKQSISSREETVVNQQYEKLAQEYVVKAKNASNEQTKQNFNLLAVENYILAENIAEAEVLIDTIEACDPNQENLLYLLKAQLALQKQQLSYVSENLTNILEPEQLTKELQQKFYKIRADLHLRTNNILDAVKDQIKLGQNKEIIQSLIKLPPIDLLNATKNSHSSDLTAWLKIAYIIKQYDNDFEKLARAITVWKQKYPNHAANDILPTANSVQQYLNTTTKSPQKIALLLPFTGKYSKIAEIIRDGFLAAYYENCKTNCNITIHLYDSNNLNIACNNAISEQVDFIVGPLIKEDIIKIINIATKNIPVLALNNVNYYNKNNIFQFGLMPENEMTAIAKQAFANGHRKVLLIVQDNALGQRLTTTFQNSWGNFGGVILDIEKLKTNDDLDKKIYKLLEVNPKYKNPKNQPKSNIDPPINDVQKRRKDVDAIIMITPPEMSRQLKPLLNFYYADDIPVYSSSIIYSAHPSSIEDQDLNDIIFCDIPWLLDNSIKSKTIYKNIASFWQNNLTESPRFYAFGIDAYKIATQLQQLQSFNSLGISGMTGILTLDNNNQQKIQRTLMWAKFHNGIPKLLTSK